LAVHEESAKDVLVRSRRRPRVALPLPPERRGEGAGG
jgi:hypothetical protein